MRVLPILLLAAAASARDLAEDAVLEGGVFDLRTPWRVTTDGITIDFGKARFHGGGYGEFCTGIGLLVEGRKKVTIRGGSWSGFRCAILVKDCEEVVLEGLDVSDNFRQRLRSTPQREDPTDWLWPHENDEQQWRKNYGAGICLENCRRCIVRECRGRAQQNGILLDRCRDCRVYDNDMSFLSGWGLAMWRSSRNVVSRNSFDWCVRGYSHGVYDRGQDSAGILVFEQCCENVFARNSATHGGDGFFLYAGNETLKGTGAGGCNDNLVVGNDFSHAVANAIEATFSKGNRFLDNRCDDSNYGVWAGYSYDTLIEGNTFRGNSIAGVAIEHGWDNRILWNEFRDNPRSVQLWWDDDAALLASAFGQAHACESRGYLVARNVFRGGDVAVFLDQTHDVRLGQNRLEGTKELLQAVRSRGVAPADVEPARTDVERDFPGRRDAFLPPDHPRGREYILVDEWGPIDPREPGIFPTRVTAWNECVFHVLGGDWAVFDLTDGFSFVRDGRLLRIRGGGGVAPFECTVEAGGERFVVRGLVLNAKWRVVFRRWERDPREDDAAWRAAEPLAELETDALDFVWGGGAPAPGVPADRFATRATAELDVPPGLYELTTRSDDGVRVLVDGRVVQEDWTWHAPKENRSLVRLGGTHAFAVEHFEIDGHAALGLDLRPLPVRDDYRGKYDTDERLLLSRIGGLGGVRHIALGNLGLALGEPVEGDWPVRLEDTGRNPAGPWARTDADGIVLSTEHLVLGTHDLWKTLAHELFHCLQRERLGAKYADLPPWAREGAALWLAGQFEERARELAAQPGAVEWLAPGLREPHALDYYALYAAAFDSAEWRHGRAKTLALVKRLLETADAQQAVVEVLRESFADFEKAAVKHARATLEELRRDGGDEIAEARELLARRDFYGALAVLPEDGTYADEANFRRAVALANTERRTEALEALRGVRGPVWLPRARWYEVVLLKELDDPRFAEAARRARLDLEPFPVYQDLLEFLGE